MNEFPERLQQLIRLRGVKASDISRATGIGEDSLSKYKSKAYNPSISTLIKLADYFGVTVDCLLRGENESESLPEELIIFNLNAKKMSPEKRKKLLEIAKVLFKEDFDN